MEGKIIWTEKAEARRTRPEEQACMSDVWSNVTFSPEGELGGATPQNICSISRRNAASKKATGRISGMSHRRPMLMAVTRSESSSEVDFSITEMCCSRVVDAKRWMMGRDAQVRRRSTQYLELRARMRKAVLNSGGWSVKLL